LIEHYVRWSNAPLERYRDHLPPHLVSQWCLPLVTDLLLQTGYPVMRVINQGVTLNIHGKLPRHQPLQVEAKFQSVTQHNGMTRVSVNIMTGTKEAPHLVETVLHMAFLLPNYKKPPKAAREKDTAQWQTVGTWQTSRHDGLKFALLTGDFNPIHWIGLAAKASAFGKKVLHGFGMLVRSYELLPDQNIQSIDVRFLRPVGLPSSPLSVQIASDAKNGHLIRLLGDKDQVHFAGRYR
jgi:hypothetical protein